MDFTALGKGLSDILPRLRGRIQLSGLIIIVVVGALVSFARPGDYIALILVGGVGVGFIVFGQLFHFLSSFTESSRPLVFLITFVSFLIFIVILLLILIIHVQPRPGFSINQAKADTFENGIEVFSETGGSGKEIGTSVSLPERMFAGDIKYTFSTPNDIPTLTADFAYIRASESNKYPDADFHEGVDWGHPWMSFNLTNPTKGPLLYTLLQIDDVEMHLIRDVILDVVEIDSYVSGKPIVMNIYNRGWGEAKHATLSLLVGDEIKKDVYNVISSKTYYTEKFSEHATVDIADLVPSDAKWNSFSPPQNMGCPANGYLTAIGRLDYTDDTGSLRHQTFRNTIYQCGSGGGNVPWSGYFNITLPDDPSKFPLIVSLSECIAANSASKLRVEYIANKSAHYRLRFTLKDNNGNNLSRQAELDILVPRPVGRRYSSPDQFIANPDVKGCT